MTSAPKDSPDTPAEPTPPKNKPAKKRKKKLTDSAIYWVMGALFLIILIIIATPPLRDNRFVQGIAGLFMALLVAVVLYHFLPGPEWLAGSIAIVSAPAFFFVILPPLAEILWPPQFIEGRVTYRGTSSGVEGVTVAVLHADQSTQTNERGEFRLGHVSSEATQLQLRYQSIDTVVTISKDETYSVIPRSESFESRRRPVESVGWSHHTSPACPDTFGMSEPSLYVFENTFPADPASYGVEVDGLRDIRLILDFSAYSGVVITHAQSVGVAPGLEVPHDGSAIRQWVFRKSGEDWPVRVEFCVARPTDDAENTEIPLRGYYSISGTRSN